MAVFLKASWALDFPTMMEPQSEWTRGKVTESEAAMMEYTRMLKNSGRLSSKGLVLERSSFSNIHYCLNTTSHVVVLC